MPRTACSKGIPEISPEVESRVAGGQSASATIEPTRSPSVRLRPKATAAQISATTPCSDQRVAIKRCGLSGLDELIERRADGRASQPPDRGSGVAEVAQFTVTAVAVAVVNLDALARAARDAALVGLVDEQAA